MHSNCSRISAAMIYKWKIYWLFEMQLSQYILHFLNGSFHITMKYLDIGQLVEYAEILVPRVLLCVPPIY